VLDITLVGSAVALSLFGDMAMYVILPARHLELGLTAIQVGILLSANRWVRLISNRIGASLLDRRGAGVLFPAAVIAGSCIAAAYALFPTFWVLLLLRLAWGACWSILRQTGAMTTIRAGGSAQPGRSMGLFLALLQGGFVAGTLLAGILFEAYGYRTTFLLAAAFSLAALPPAIAGGKKLVAVPAGSRATPSPGGSASFLVSRALVVSFVGPGLIMATLGYLLRERFGDSVEVAGLTLGVTALNGLLLSAQHLIHGLGSPLLGILLDRFRIRRVEFMSFATGGAMLVLLSYVNSPAAIVILIIILFAAGAAAWLAVEAQGALGGSGTYAKVATATDIGSALGPLLGWMGIELARSAAVLWLGGGLYLLAAVAVVVHSRVAQRSDTQER
jgi:predicted MFS family arabinose efflux permease